MKGLCVLALTGCMLAGCGNGNNATGGAEEPVAATVASSPTGVRHVLYTHCGVYSTTLDGALWVAAPPLADDSNNPPPGWDENETPGSFVQTSASTAVFNADSGVFATFKLAAPQAKDPAKDCE